jgi:hypothetical protein
MGVAPRRVLQWKGDVKRGPDVHLWRATLIDRSGKIHTS